PRAWHGDRSEPGGPRWLGRTLVPGTRTGPNWRLGDGPGRSAALEGRVGAAETDPSRCQAPGPVRSGRYGTGDGAVRTPSYSLPMPICGACGQDNPDVARFCLACGSALGAEEATPQEERRFISVLFVDLVGFTARAEQLDPEDVRAILTPYHETVRRE